MVPSGFLFPQAKVSFLWISEEKGTGQGLQRTRLGLEQDGGFAKSVSFYPRSPPPQHCHPPAGCETLLSSRREASAHEGHAGGFIGIISLLSYFLVYFLVNPVER